MVREIQTQTISAQSHDMVPMVPPALFPISHICARRSPGGGGGHQVTVSRGGGGDCKGISRQTVVPPQPLALRVGCSHDPPERPHQGVCTECCKIVAHLVKGPTVANTCAPRGGGGDSAGPRTPTTPPPQRASGQQLVGGVVGVQNQGVPPPGCAPSVREWSRTQSPAKNILGVK